MNNSINMSTNSIVKPINIRVLTITQIKDTIIEIYENKLKYDKQCLDGQLPLITMEQYLYVFLNQKFGLKVIIFYQKINTNKIKFFLYHIIQTLIIEWAAAIFNGIKKFAYEDNDIAVFGKIIKNEIEEQFQLVQLKVKATIKDLIKLNIKNLFPFKLNKEIKEMIDTKCKDSITEQEALDIIKYMYEEKDAHNLHGKMEPFFYRIPPRLPEYTCILYIKSVK